MIIIILFKIENSQITEKNHNKKTNKIKIKRLFKMEFNKKIHKNLRRLKLTIFKIYKFYKNQNMKIIH